MSQQLLQTHEVYREIHQSIPELSQKERGTEPGNIESWLKNHYVSLQHFQAFLMELTPQLDEERTVEVVRDDDAVLFCTDQSLIKYLGLIEDLIKKHFPTVSKINFFLEYDPETSDKWVSADTEISGDIDQVIEWENHFIKEWVSQVPYRERNKIRLSCDII